MVTKRAVIFGSGALYGAYSAGFASELHRKVGSNYFSSVYGLSVGTTIGTFFVANQPDIIEQTWRNHVDGFKLIRPHNLIKGKRPLDLDYLISLFNNGVAHLDVPAVMKSPLNLRYSVIDYYTGKMSWVRPTAENILPLIKAACSPLIVGKPQQIGDRLLLDAGFIYGGVPELDDIVREHDEVVYVSNVDPIDTIFPSWKLLNPIFSLAAKFGGYPKPLQEVFRRKWKVESEMWDNLKANKNIKFIHPNKRILSTSFDTKKDKINSLIDLGQGDARDFVRKI